MRDKSTGDVASDGYHKYKVCSCLQIWTLLHLCSSHHQLTFVSVWFLQSFSMYCHCWWWQSIFQIILTPLQPKGRNFIFDLSKFWLELRIIVWVSSIGGDLSIAIGLFLLLLSINDSEWPSTKFRRSFKCNPESPTFFSLHQKQRTHVEMHYTEIKQFL